MNITASANKRNANTGILKLMQKTSVIQISLYVKCSTVVVNKAINLFHTQRMIEKNGGILFMYSITKKPCKQ